MTKQGTESRDVTVCLPAEHSTEAKGVSLKRGGSKPLGKLPGSRVPEISHKSQDTNNCFYVCLIFSSVPF